MSESYAILGAAVGSILCLASVAAGGRLQAPQLGGAPAYASVPTSAVSAPAGADSSGPILVHTNAQRTLPREVETAIVTRARLEVERGVRYDASYRVLSSYPNGDVPADVGACTDVVVRAFRTVGIDLQVLVHEDVLAAPLAYAFTSEVGNANIDHRRVLSLHAFFERNALALGTDTSDPSSFRPGDVVFYAWKRCYPGWPCLPEHVAVVSDRTGPRGLPLVVQNGGPVANEADVLDQPKMVGHFRLNDVYRSSRVGK